MYLTLFSVFIFSVVMSAVIGYLFHAVLNTLISSKDTTPLVGAGISILFISFMITMFLFGIWYLYAIGIILTLGVYFVLLQSSYKRNKNK